MEIIRLSVGMLQTNAYLLLDETSKETLIIDPGDEAERILDEVKQHGGTITAIAHTHAHGDHIGADREIVEATGAAIMIHELEADWLTNPNLNMSSMIGCPLSMPAADRLLNDGDTVRFGESELTVLHTPGHSPGSVSFYTPGHLFCGDLLFASSVGRTDLSGGSFDVLENSIRNKVYTLPVDTIVYCGHGPTTTVGQEKTSNPFVRE
jgi:hydroxyacylglutathione hydrolase